MTTPIIFTYYTKGTPYEEEARGLEESAMKFGYDIVSQAVEDRGSWELNTAIKPRLVIDALDRYQRPLLLLDADIRIKERIPLFERRRHARWYFDWSLVPSSMQQIKPGMEAMRYKPLVAPWGEMWQTGIVFFDYPCSVATKLALDRWRTACVDHPRVWDQLSLQGAYHQCSYTLRPAYLPLPQEYRAGGKYFSHDSMFHRHWKRDTPRRVLVIGSAPHLSEYAFKYMANYITEGFWVAAINNAWIPLHPAMNFWYHSTDFDDRRGRPEGETFVENPDWQLTAPHWLHGKTRILLPDVLLHLLNQSIRDKRKLEVHVACSDFIYPEGKTHFYGEGQADPLRFGEQELELALRKVQQFYNLAGAKIYNAGAQEETRLPFERADPTHPLRRKS